MRDPNIRYKKLKKPPLKKARSTLWDYPSQHYGHKTQGSPHYRGATPSHVIWQFVEHYTKRGDSIIDPFCGSGTTIDVCRDLGRIGRGLDIAPQRDDISQGSAERLPFNKNEFDHAFFDPPYADNLRYSGKKGCIGETKYEDGSWQQSMIRVFEQLDQVLKPGAFTGVFLCDIKKKNGAFFPLGPVLYELVPEHWGFEDHIIVPRHSARLQHDRPRVQNNILLRGFSHMIIFSKP